MKIEELRKNSVEELRRMLAEKTAGLRDLRFKLAGGDLKQVHLVQDTRRLVARINTVLKEKYATNK